MPHFVHVSVHQISFELNGKSVERSVGPEVLIADLLRDDIGLTGTKIGCSIGVCGACSILVDGTLMSGCLLPAIMVDGRSVTTIEGIAPSEDELSPLQQAFITKGGFQCGICTSGQIIAATALLASNAKPNREEIKEWMMGNLCRCTGYYKIIDSIEEAAGIVRENV
jgi:aerobic-type carbon monoxide dehydrogenase small subunit (CoxS/CutS family)